MISKPNNDDASTAMGRNAKFSLLGVLMLSVGLLLSLCQTVVAAPGKGSPLPKANAVSYTVVPYKDDQVAPSGVDIVELIVNPAPATGTEYSISLGGSGSSVGFTNSSGIVFFYIQRNTAGTVPVQVMDVNGNPVGNPITMTFLATPTAPVAANSYFEVVTNGVDADGVSQDIVEAFLFDQYGNPVGTSYNPANPPTVNWTIPANAVAVGNPNTTVTSGGTSTLGLTDHTAETVKVTAIASWTDPSTGITTTFQLADQSGNAFLPTTFVQPTPNITAGASYIVTVVSPMAADGSSMDEVQAYVVDQNGVAMSGVTVNFNFGSLTEDPSSITTTNSSGIATLYLKTFTAGSYQVTATVNGQPLYDQANTANAYVTVVFYNPPPSTSASWITPVITPTTVGSGQDEVQIHLSTGTQALINATVNLTFPAGVTPVTPGPYVTDGSGNIYVYMTSTVANTPFDIVATYTDPAPGGLTYTLHDETITTQPYSIVTWVPDVPSSTNSYLVVTQDGATDDGVAQDIVTAYLYDQYGNAIIPADNPSLSWSVSPNTPANAGVTSTPGSNVYTVAYTSMTQGTYQVSLTVNGNPAYLQGTTSPAPIHFVVGQPVTGDPGGPSDGGDPGGGSPGNGGTPPTNGGGGSTGGGGGSGPTGNNGFTWLYVESQYNDRLADGQQQDSVFAFITDATKNPVPNVTVTLYIQNPGGTITSGEQWTTGGGVSTIQVTTGPDGIARAAMTSTTPGSVWVYASINVGGTDQLIAGSDVELDFVTKPDITNIQTALTVVVGEALADGQQQNVVKAHVVDLDGNVMPNQAVYFAIDSGSGTIVTPQPVMTDANGDAMISITSKTVGYVLITAVVDNEKIVFGSPARVYFAAINIYVPRVFTPNNDGTNDLLKPILVGISTFHYFNVYNRWGNLVYQTQDPNQGWDGTFKGVPQPVETYLWVAEGIDENGHKVVAKGMTSLVR